MYKSSHESVFCNNICKNFDTGIYRPTSLHMLSRPTAHEVAERWPNSRP